MTVGALGLGLAVLFALLDLAVAPGPAPSGARRLLRALPAGVLAVTLRLADAPPLPAAALLAFAVADALALSDGEPRMGVWTLTLLAQLLLTAAVWELASPALLRAQPWRGAEGVVVLAAGLLLLRRRRPAGPLRALAPLPILLLAVAGVGSGAQGSTALALGFVAAVALWSAAAIPGEGAPPRWERALRSAAPLAFAWPLLPLPR